MLLHIRPTKQGSPQEQVQPDGRTEIEKRTGLVTNRITKGVKKESSSLITKRDFKKIDLDLSSSLITNLVPEDIPTQRRSRFSAVDDAHPDSEMSELGQDCYRGSETRKYESTC